MIIIRQSETEWLAKAPAKLNLFFEVIGKRGDGFHEILSLACPVGLYDTIYFRLAEGESIYFVCENMGDDVPADFRNIVVRALERLREFAGIRSGTSVRLQKKIPSQAGLGGGSSDAAAALLLGVEAWKIQISREELYNIAAGLGSDVALFLENGAVVSRGRGEIIEPISNFPQLDFVLLKPDFGLSTADVYRECMKFHDGDTRKLPDLSVIRTPEEVAKICFNRLERSAESLVPELAEIREYFDSLGCLKVAMSGSGTTLFGLCRDPDHAETVAKKLDSAQLGNVFTVKSV